MITVNDSVEIKGTVTTTGTDSLTVTLNEVYLDSQWRKFSPVKTLTIATSDYDTELTPQELALVKKLSVAKGSAVSLTPDEQVIAASITAKLG